MEQSASKNINNHFNTNIYYDLETSGAQSSNLYKMLFIFSTIVLIRHLWQLKPVVFLHWCLICAVPLSYDDNHEWCQNLEHHLQSLITLLELSVMLLIFL
jgi:hypothetical protein